MTFYATDERIFRITSVGEMKGTSNFFIECSSDVGVVAFWGSVSSWENLKAIQARPTPFTIRCGIRSPSPKFPSHKYWVPETATIQFLDAESSEPLPVTDVAASREETQSANPLYVVTCTKRKIWQIDDSVAPYFPAQEAYRGDQVREWMASPRRAAAKYWLFLSAKYGFIEPEHPIGNYDVTFSVPASGPISDDYLKAQVMCQKRWNESVALRDFRTIYVWASEIYEEKTRIAFAGIKGAEVIRLTSL